MSMHRLSAGAGYRYLLRDTACGDAPRPAGTPLTAYYTDSGYPSGRWFGAGLEEVGLTAGDVVGEEQMALLYGAGRHPLSGEVLGRAYRQYAAAAERIAQRIAALPADLSPADRAVLTEQIVQVEAERPTPHAVAGFDLTFTVPKSVSVLWAVANPQVQAVISQAHQDAVTDALTFVQDRALFTRTGTDGIAQVRTRGLLATAFEHWDTRTGDPNLHTHVVIANKVQGPDGQWRSLDSRALHHAAVAVSELYDDLIADHLTARLPVAWGWRDRGERRTPAFELDGISDRLLTLFSTRSVQVDSELHEGLATFVATHGRSPNRVETLRLRQQATRASRPAKTVTGLPELMSRWRARASEHTGQTAAELTTGAVQGDGRVFRSEEVPAEFLETLAERTLAGVMERRATWTPWNITSEALRATRDLRLATTKDRLALTEQISTLVLEQCVELSAPEPVALPAAYVDAQGRSVFTRPAERKLSHPRIIDAEQRLLAAHQRTGAQMVPAADAAWDARTADVDRQPVPLAADQLQAVVALASSGRALEVLVGPAGSGKTTTLCALRTVWETRYGRGSVIGLAPSATAAHALSESLGIPCENTSKWLHETTGPAGNRRWEQLAVLRIDAAGTGRGVWRAAGRLAQAEQEAQRWQMHRDQLLIVDEASLAPTLDLDQLCAQAEQVGAKIVLVGDHHQLASVDAGGAFGLLTQHGTPRELRSLWRFEHPWEAAATRQLRLGDPTVLDTYTQQDRISDGPTEVMTDAAYQAWQLSLAQGQTALLLAADTATVTALNQRAQHDRVLSGHVQPGGITLHDGSHASVGDQIVTRRNQRRLTLPDGQHVRNGSLWTVHALGPDGSLTITPSDREQALVTLPAAYVREHVELGYASTIHRAQGLTVDTCHVLVTPAMTREALYVAMTRGRQTNHAYVTLDSPVLAEIPDQPEVRSARQILQGVLANTHAELSATQTVERSHQQATALTRLLPIQDTLTAHTDRLRWEPALHASSLTHQQVAQVLSSPACGALFAALRRGARAGLPMPALLAEAIRSRPLENDPNIQDPAAVLHHRLTRLVHDHPQPDGPSDPMPAMSPEHEELLTAIDSYDTLIQQRLEEALTAADTSVDGFDAQAWRARFEATNDLDHTPSPQAIYQ